MNSNPAISLVLNENGLADTSKWEAAGYSLPKFDRKAVTAATKEAPTWVHFGAGNIFKAFQANVVQNLLNNGTLDKGLVVVEGYDYEIIEKMNHPHDDYTILVTLKSDGQIQKTVIGSIVESLTANSENDVDWTRLQEIFSNKSLQMVSFTITEKGYSLVDASGGYFPAVLSDFVKGPDKPQSYIGKIASLLYTRFTQGGAPIAMVSMDNCSHNGDKLFDAVHAFAKKWASADLVDAGFVDYIEDPKQVSFPWSMIDKITPRPDLSVEKLLIEDGLADVAPIVTSKNTYISAFVNAEECEYLVIEDSFPNGHPALEKGGVIFTERETVDKVEKMKVCTCLNPLHTALAIFGCLLDYSLISDEMKDATLKKLVEVIGYKEGLPVVVNPIVLDPKEFIDCVLNIRIPNPFMPDTPQRIATDTSQKLAIRFGETIKAYAASPSLNVSELKAIPLVFAGWLRYLMAVDDNGKSFTPSSDPLLDSVMPYVSDIKLGDSIDVKAKLNDILQNETIFGVNLFDVGLADLVCEYFEGMISGTNAVRKVLETALA
jgi:Mannitol-1-phosphate/altronate dehydrogenases